MAVLQSLAQSGKTSYVALWGRSMGAATAIFFNSETSPIPIKCLVLDSAFSNFQEVAMHTVTEMMKAPPELF